MIRSKPNTPDYDKNYPIIFGKETNTDVREEEEKKSINEDSNGAK